MKTTKAHFKIFKKECEKWINAFGLYGNKYYFEHSKNDNLSEDNLGYTIMPDEHYHRTYTIGLPTETSSDITISELKEVAFHEVMESFLGKMRSLAEGRFTQNSEIDDEIHNIIMTLERVVYRKQ